MGWTFRYGGTGGLGKREFLDKEFCWTNEGGGGVEIVKSAMVGSVYYAAARRTFPEPEKAPIVFGLVVLTKSNERAADGYSFGWKDMSEDMGPCESNCPIGLLELLSEPAGGEYAVNWRARCRENAAKKSAWAKIKPKAGQKIRMKAPLKFTDGCELAEFEVAEILRRGKKRNVFRSIENGGLYRIAGLAHREFEIIGGAA